jgi:hypothetical protein
MTQIWALYRQSGSDRLEKQPTDLRRRHYYMRDGTLGFKKLRMFELRFFLGEEQSALAELRVNAL